MAAVSGAVGWEIRSKMQPNGGIRAEHGDMGKEAGDLGNTGRSGLKGRKEVRKRKEGRKERREGRPDIISADQICVWE